MTRRASPWLLALLMLAACQPASLPAIAPAAVTTALTVTSLPTLPLVTPSITASPSQTSTLTATSTPQPPLTGLCSPLQGVALSQLTQILQGGMETPHPGQDDGHHGDDFAFYRFGDRLGMEGLPVLSALTGTVVGVTSGRKPYGNMLMIETPLEQLPPGWLAALPIPTPSPALPTDPRMQNCPTAIPTQPGDPSRRSLYLLYAHLREPTTLQPGDPVGCGQQVGEVGNTGLSGNPHLHLEVRVGPAGARFDTMAYYENVSQEEYNSYCTWRVSQYFQLLDPMTLLSLPTTQP